jgi:hypothetical protein
VNQPRAVRRLQAGRGLRDDAYGPRGIQGTPASPRARICGETSGWVRGLPWAG